MEFVVSKRGRKRKRRRRCLINLTKQQRRDQRKFEVRPGKRKQIIIEHNNHYNCIEEEKIIENTMEASAFWENYKAAHEWQHRHNVTWWKTRCFALEHENHVLREKIRNLVQNPNSYDNFTITVSEKHHNVENTELTDEDDNIEFELNEDMMNFLTQSMQHKIELKNKKECEEAAEKREESDESEITGGQAWIHKRNQDAKLLYGDASSKILAMETALETSMARHLDKAKPQYWPNIPLKL